MKLCTRCNTEKPFGDYYKQKHGKNGLCAHCKSCEKLLNYRKDKKKKYNLTDEQLDYLMSIDKCESCGDNVNLFDKSYDGHCIDHSHTTGEVRGVLCRKCNIILGLAFDEPKRLFNLIQFLCHKDNLEAPASLKKFISTKKEEMVLSRALTNSLMR